MEYSKIEAITKAFVELLYNTKCYIFYKTITVPPDIKLYEKTARDICFVVGDLDYVIPDEMLKLIHTVYLNTDKEVGLFDSKQNSMDDVEKILNDNYNPKMMSKILNHAKEIHIRVGNDITQITLEQSIKLLHL